MKIKNRKRAINELKAKQTLVINKKKKYSNYNVPSWYYSIGIKPPYKYIQEFILKIKQQHHENKN